MAKQLNVNLAFNADTSSAIKNLNELNATLSKIGSIDIKSNSLSAEMKQAAASAQELQMHLSRAYDSKLGNLNLGKFEQSLKSSNTSLAKLSTDLLGAGRNGEQAFLRLQSSIASANTQLIQSKGLLAEFATTLKNTARWQLSSSVLHGFMGAIQSAYGYSQRLNESLNNIRIVTGYNVEKMAEFAEQANKAAKALSTTTTDYTNASLIYYQQGLSDSEVQARTDVTVKMANVANKTASEVSDQMTAVWNNFYDGSKSLEYYADVMTALGAATASSTDEIAGGLEKFAAVADTIGLSYEYAASALATITSNTRQSEEVVGTALKTIFARIQGLNLGETLDDGTTLNKYSEALQKVGISIFDTAGNLRDMDDILDDMGSKWEQLNKAQQTALAQTVAGVRQYTQLVALMDNWDKGDNDSFQANLATAYGSEGALAEQHAIYEQGWEAAQKRVKAGWEAIYKELVPDEAFIKLYDGFADILGIIEAVVKTMGGLEGIIMLAASAMMNKFAPAIGEGIQSGIQKLDIFKDKVKNIFTGGDGSVLTAIQGGFTAMKNPIATLKGENTNPYSAAEKSTERIAQNLQAGTTHIQQQVTQSLKVAESWAGVTTGFQQQIKMQQEMNSLTNVVVGNAKNLSKATQERLMHEIQTTEELGIQAAELTQQVEDTRELISSNVNSALTEESLRGSITAAAKHPVGDPNTVIQTASLALPQNLSEDAQSYMRSLLGAEASIETIGEGMTALMIPSQNVKASIQDFSVAADMALSDISELSSLMQILDQINIDDNFGSADQKAKAMADAINAAKNLSGPLKKNLLDMVGSYSQMSKSDFTKGLQKQLKTVQSAAKAYKVQEEHISNAVKLGSKLGMTTQKNTQVTNQYNRALQNVKDNINNALKASLKIGPTLAKGFSSLSSVGMSINMISNAFDTLTDSSASWTQKLSSGLMALSMSFQAVTTVSGMFKSSMSAISGIIATQNAQLALNTAITAGATNAKNMLTAAESKEAVGAIALAAAEMLQTEATEDQVKAMVTEQLMSDLGMEKDAAEALSKTIVAGAIKLEDGALQGVAPDKAADIVLTEGQTAANWKEVASLAAKNWWLLLIIAALAILVGGIIAVVNARKAEVEANKKSAEADKEAAAAAKEEAEANRDLVNSYYDMLKTYQETGEGKEECREAALAVAKAYGIEGAEVLILAGKYDELNKRIKEKQKLENNNVKKATDQAKSSVALAMADALRDGDGYKTSSGGYYGQFDNGMYNGDEQAAYKALETGEYTYLQKAGGEIAFNIKDISSPEQMYAYYQELEKFLAEQRRIANEEDINLGASEIYQDALAEYNAGLEYYNQLKELMGEAEELGFDILALETTSQSGKGIDEIKTLEEYESFRDNYLKQQKEIMKSEQIEEGSTEWERRLEAAEAYLGTLDEVKEFFLESKGFEDTGYSDEIKKWYDTLSEEDQNIFWQLNIDEDASLEETKTAMQRMQDYVNSNNLIATFKVTTTLEDMISSNNKDWDEIKTQMFATWKANGIDPDTMWYDFLAMSDEERVTHVRNIGKSSAQASAYTAVDNIATSKAAFDTAQGNFDTAQDNFDFAYGLYQQAAGVIADYEENASEFYRIAQSENTSDGPLFKFKGNIWSTLLDNGYAFDSESTKSFVQYMAGSLKGTDYATSLNINDDNQALMRYLEGVGNDYDDYVIRDENGKLQWNPEYLQFDDQGNIMSDYADLLGQSLDFLTYDAQTSIAQEGGRHAARYIAAHDSTFAEDRALHEAAKGKQESFATWNRSLYGTDGTSDNIGGLEENLAENQNALDMAATAYEENLIAQNEWIDAFSQQTENMDLDAEQVETYANNLLTLAESGEAVASSLMENQNGARLMAQGIIRMNRGIQDLADNWDDYIKVIDESNTTSQEYATTIKELRSNTEDILDLDMSSFSDGWFTSQENMALFQRIAEGDLTAIDELREAAAEQILVDASLDYSGVEGGKAVIDGLIDDLVANPPQIGASLDSTEFGNSLLDMLNKTDMTVAEMQALFDALGYEPVIDYKEIPASSASASEMAQAVAVFDPITSSWKEGTVQSGSQLAENAVIRVPIINGSKTTYKGAGSSTGKKPTLDNKGSGGGGGSKAPEKKSSSDKTRYHTIQNQLEDLKAEYEEISEAADRAFGKDKLEYIDDQIAKTEELIAAQEELLGTYGDWDMSGYDPNDFGGFENLRQNLQFDKEIMEAYFSDLFKNGMQIEYDEKGNISNYRQLEDYMQSVYNNNTTKLSGEKWEVFEKKYEKMQEYIKQYEETYDELRDAEQEYQDLINRRMDLQLTKIQYQVELKMNIAEDSLALLEYQLEKIEDDATKAAGAIRLFSEKAEALYDQMQADREGLNNILRQQLDENEIKLFYEGDMGVLKDKEFTENQIEAIKEYRDNLLDLNSGMMEIRDSVQEQLMEVFDEWNEKLSTGIDTLEHYGNVLEGYKNIVDVVGKDTLGLSDQFMADLSQAQISNAIDQVNATRDVYESMAQAQKEAEDALAQARINKDAESTKYWEDTLTSITEEAQAAQEELLNSWESALNAIASQFEITVQVLIDNFNNSIYSLGGLEGLSEDFSRTQENRDMMLDDYQKIYELSKLTRDINGKLDDTKIIAGKQKLRDLIKEINEYQEEGVKMSQYDLEYLQAEYELRLAEIELEEAQRAKNTVQMSRDNEGNWSYVYTQNTDAVDAAQQKYEDALYAMQDLSSNYIDEMSEQLISTSQEMQEALAAIRIQDYANINDYYAEVERVQKQYQDELAMQENELNKAIDNNKVLYDTDWTNYHNATGYKISDTKEFATAFRDTLLGALMDSETDTSNFSTIVGSSVDTLVQGLRDSADQYFQNIAAAMEAAGTSTDTFSKDAQEDIDDIITKSDEGATAVEDMSERMQTAFDTAADNLVLWQETYGTVISAMIEQNEALVESFNKMFEALSATGEDFNIATNIEFKKIPNEEPDTGFDTGGYTGEWGKAGKLAILHEKELVLNASDTENLFKTLLLSSQILETIDLNARQASLGIGAMTAAAVKDDSTQTLEQTVHITAEFPGVSDRNELEEAFDNLINRAAQYAYRTL